MKISPSCERVSFILRMHWFHVVSSNLNILLKDKRVCHMHCTSHFDRAPFSENNCTTFINKYVLSEITQYQRYKKHTAERCEQKSP